MGKWAGTAIVLGLLLGGPTAGTASALTLRADHPESGWIRLTVPDAGFAANVALSEQGTLLAQGAPSAGQYSVGRAASWRCDRLARTFEAVASYPDGTTQTASTTVRTPSCSKRFVLRVRRHRHGVTLAAADRWKLGGVSLRTCVTAPGAEAACGTLALPAGHSSAARAYRTRGPGLWRVSLASPWGQRLASTFYVRPRRALRLLATGDSMIQIVDSYLKDRLGPHNVHVRSDARISTGLSKPFLLDWPRLAQRQARAIRPDVTVVFIGANDGFPFGSVDCCGDAWVAAYAKRAETMMRAYSRGGHGLVYWLTLPAPRPAEWRPIYPAVNRAIERAAATFGGSVKVLDIAKTFTPGFRYRPSIRWRGRVVVVRNADGVHLNATGAGIAEALIERALRRDGAL